MAIYAKWDGEKGYAQVDDSRGYIRTDAGLPVSGGAANYLTHGYYPVVVTDPTVPDGSIIDAPVWGFDGSTITLTWSTRVKTQDELDEEAADPVLSQQLYYVLKWLRSEGVISQTNIDNAPQALRDAYAARARLET